MTTPVPTELNLHKHSRVLEIRYPENVVFNLPCEYLRVLSPSAEVQGHGPGQQILQIGKELVNIDKIEMVGNYAVCLYFDDGHDTGIYSWEYLYELGQNHQQNWQAYLAALEKAGHHRKELPI